MIYDCKRCEYETDYICNLKKHLSRKKECADIKKCGISSTCLLQAFDKDKSDYQHNCSFCDEQFKSKSGKYNHQIKCKLNQEILKLKKDNQKFYKLEAENEILRKLLLTNQQNNQQNIHIETNIYNNITINVFGSENKSYITDKFMVECIKNGIDGVCNLIQLSLNCFAT